MSPYFYTIPFGLKENNKQKYMNTQPLLNAVCTVSFAFCMAIVMLSCDPEEPNQYPEINRLDSLPPDISKRVPLTDHHPPVLYDMDYEIPVPLDAAVNTSGAEDSPFITPDGNELFFFFTPDVRIPVEKQVLDQVSGVWRSQKVNGVWQLSERLWLQEPGKLSLDGAVAIYGDEMWFASAREGYTGVNMFTAKKNGINWTNWTYCGDQLMKDYQIGEVHMHGDDLYFHSARAGSKGGLDLWVTSRNGQQWTEPRNLGQVNSTGDDGFPFITDDGKELWFTRTYLGTPAIFRSLKSGESFGPPELIISQFAGEPTLDAQGNIYFVHHFFENSVMIEADIYVARKKR